MDIRKWIWYCSTCHQTDFVCFSIVDLTFDWIFYYLFLYHPCNWTILLGFYHELDVQNRCEDSPKNQSLFKQARIGTKNSRKNSKNLRKIKDCKTEENSNLLSMKSKKINWSILIWTRSCWFICIRIEYNNMYLNSLLLCLFKSWRLSIRQLSTMDRKYDDKMEIH